MNEEIDLELTTKKSNEIAKALAQHFDELMHNIPPLEKKKYSSRYTCSFVIKSFGRQHIANLIVSA